jgi:hypothetical protein
MFLSLFVTSWKIPTGSSISCKLNLSSVKESNTTGSYLLTLCVQTSPWTKKSWPRSRRITIGKNYIQNVRHRYSARIKNNENGSLRLLRSLTYGTSLTLRPKHSHILRITISRGIGTKLNMAKRAFVFRVRNKRYQHCILWLPFLIRSIKIKPELVSSIIVQEWAKGLEWAQPSSNSFLNLNNSSLRKKRNLLIHKPTKQATQMSNLSA